MNSRENIQTWIGARIDDIYGARAGEVEDVYADARSGEPLWLLTRARRFDRAYVLVPIGDAVAGAGRVWVPYERQAIRAAPVVAFGAPLKQRSEMAACAHYGLGGARGRAIDGLAPGEVTAVSAVFHSAEQTA